MTAPAFAILLTSGLIGLPVLVLTGYLVIAVVMLPFEIMRALKEEGAK